MQTEKTVQTSNSHYIGTKPFTPFIILSTNDSDLLFFSQSFSLLSGIPPMILSIPKSIINDLSLERQRKVISGCYEIYQYKGRDSLNFQRLWAQELIHEIRTASFIIDLGAHTLEMNNQLTSIVFEKIQRTSRRQIISTRIASDFIQMVTSAPKIYFTSLFKILVNSILNSPSVTQKKKLSHTFLESTTIGTSELFIWGNYHFLSDFFRTILNWFDKIPLTINLEILNDISALVSISSNQILSHNPGFALIVQYMYYIAAYFNSRSWVTQSSINIVFPLTFSVRNQTKH